MAAHQQVTRDWWAEVLPKCEPYISPIVVSEIQHGDPGASQLRVEAVRGMRILEITEEVVDLAAEYFARVGMPQGSRADSYHLALAAWHGMDFLVTWNCKHIAAARVRRIVEQVNAERDIRTPEICTPEQFMEI